MDIVGVNTAGSANLDSTAAISDAGATSVNVTGLADVSGTSISLGGGTFNAGTLDVQLGGRGGDQRGFEPGPRGREHGGQRRSGLHRRASRMRARRVSAVTGLVDVTGTSISLGGGTFNAGSIDLQLDRRRDDRGGFQHGAGRREHGRQRRRQRHGRQRSDRVAGRQPGQRRRGDADGRRGGRRPRSTSPGR